MGRLPYFLTVGTRPQQHSARVMPYGILACYCFACPCNLLATVLPMLYA